MPRPSRFILGSLLLAFLLTATDGYGAPLTGGTAPGGFERADGTESLVLWFRADQGVFEDTTALDFAENSDAVARWDNVSGTVTNFDSVQPSGGSRPSFSATSLNNRPVIEFDGNDEIPLNNPSLFNMTGNETAFLVPRVDTTNFDSFLSSASTNRGYSVNSPSGELFTNSGFTFATDWFVNSQNTDAISTGQFFIATGTGNPFSGTNSDLRIAGNHGAATDLNGALAEIAVFNRDLNTAERVVVENHLSSKYGITLGANDLFGGDASGFDRDVIGVGQITGDQVVEAGAAGFGIRVASSDLVDGESVFAGHAVGVNGFTDADLTGLVDSRFIRVWSVDKRVVDSLGGTLSFNLQDAGVAPSGFTNPTLLYRSGTSGDFTDVGAIAVLDSGTISFTLTDAQLQNGFYTLGFSIPEPSSGLMLWGAMACLALRRRRGKSRPKCSPNTA